MTNFHPRGRLAINVRPPGGHRTRLFGPYPEGQYTDRDIVLYPMEEYPQNVMIWSDPKSENGLAFPKPGRYRIDFVLESVTAQHSSVAGAIPPTGPSPAP